MERTAFEQLFSRHAGALFGFLAYRTGDRQLAEDLVSATFERVLTSRRGFSARRGSERTWVYTIALNLLRDHQRREAVERRALAASAADARLEPATDPFASPERADGLQEALESLSAVEREAIALRYGADLTAPEVAEVLSESLTTIEGRIYGGLRKLRTALGVRS